MIFLCPMKHNHEILSCCKASRARIVIHSSCVDAEFFTCMDAESNIVQQMGNQNENHYLLTVSVEI